MIKKIKNIFNFLKPIIEKYKFYLYKFSHDKYEDFYPKKAVVFILGSILGVWIMFYVLEFMFDIGYYFATKKEETIYLSDSVELETDRSIWGVKGCPTEECDSETALYFRIKLTWFNSFWSVVARHKLFYPDIVASAIPTGQTECHVISYGLRYRILMFWNYYPQILDVKCHN